MIDELSVMLGTPIKVTVGRAVGDPVDPQEERELAARARRSHRGVPAAGAQGGRDRRREPHRRTADQRHQPDHQAGATRTIFTAIQRRASDIHIETGDDAVHVKYRIDGVLQPAMRPIAKQFHSSIISRIKVMAELDIAEKRVPQDGRFKRADAGQDDRLPRLDHAERARRGRGHPYSRQGVDQRAVHRAAARHPRVPRAGAEAVPQVHPRAVRHGAGHRARRDRARRRRSTRRCRRSSRSRTRSSRSKTRSSTSCAASRRFRSTRRRG